MNLCEFALGAEGHFPVLSPHPSEIPETFYQNSTILVWSTTQEISRFFSAISREFPGFPVLSGLKKTKNLSEPVDSLLYGTWVEHGLIKPVDSLIYGTWVEHGLPCSSNHGPVNAAMR